MFANSGRDLVTFDISNIHDIKIMERLEDVFENHYYPELPASAAYADFSEFNPEGEVIIGYTLETREKPIQQLEWFNDAVAFNSADGGNTGTGGSMARFNIGGDFLYTVGRSDLQVFDISNLSNPQKLNSHHVGWQIETILIKKGTCI